jgi:hypothetical protein
VVSSSLMRIPSKSATTIDAMVVHIEAITDATTTYNLLMKYLRKGVADCLLQFPLYQDLRGMFHL